MGVYLRHVYLFQCMYNVVPRIECLWNVSVLRSYNGQIRPHGALFCLSFPTSRARIPGYFTVGLVLLFCHRSSALASYEKSRLGCQSSHDGYRWCNESAARYFPSRRWAALATLPTNHLDLASPACSTPESSTGCCSHAGSTNAGTQTGLPMGAFPFHVDGSSGRFQGCA